MDIIALDSGAIINRRFSVNRLLGEGNCGAVYKVTDEESPQKLKYALKTEARASDAHQEVLKVEAAVLKKLEQRNHVPRLIYGGRRDEYNYIVMTLFGQSLNELQNTAPTQSFSAGTVSKAGIHVIYGIKQLHDIGYIHRDIKPANMVVGRGSNKKIVYLIDYGMAREYVIWEGSKPRHRQPRETVLIRGTPRFCSPFVHQRQEQSRRDDLWSLMYSLIWLHRGTLPWAGKKSEEISRIKQTIKDEALYDKCPPEWLAIQQHIRGLQYPSLPDYKFVYDQLKAVMVKEKTGFTDPYDWEMKNHDIKTASNAKNEHKKCKQPKSSTEWDDQSAEDQCDSSTLPTTLPTAFNSNDIGI